MQDRKSQNESLEMQIFGPDATAAEQAPFTNLCYVTSVSEFQKRLLEQAAKDNYETVQAFLTSTATSEQLESLFTSCFMNECLRDELFVSIFKAAAPQVPLGEKVCQLLQLALGHFGPSDALRDFVLAMVATCDGEYKLLELLARRMYVHGDGMVPACTPVKVKSRRYAMHVR